MQVLSKKPSHAIEIELNSASYGASILALMKLAKGGTGGSKVAAQVLLSAYNGSYFQLDVSALCNLDESNYQHAMNVIHGRARTYKEPQSFIKNGDKHFQALWDQWKNSLHVEERFKSMCYTCYGSGKESDDEGEPTDQQCLYCHGHGNTLPDGLEYSHES